MTESKDGTNEEEKPLAEVRFELPIYIPLPDGVYKVYVSSMVAEAKLRRIDKHTPMSESVKVSKNVIRYVPDLRYDPFNSTEVTVMYRPSPDVLRKLEDSELEDKDPYTKGPINPLLEESLLFVNKIVSTYQYCSGNVAIGRVQTWDIGIIQMAVRPHPRSSPGTIKSYSLIGYSRSTNFTRAPTDREALVQIVDKVKRDWSVSTQTRLLLTARYLYLMGEFSASVITAQSALELFLSRRLENHLTHIIIRRRHKDESIPLNQAGLSIMIRNGLKQAIGKCLSDIDSSLAQEVSEARKQRNDIIHGGTEPSMVDADRCIKTFSRAIDRLDSEL